MAKNILRDKYDRTYHFQDDIPLAVGPQDSNKPQSAKNIFDNLPAFQTVQYDMQDKLACYLSTVPKDVKTKMSSNGGSNINISIQIYLEWLLTIILFHISFF